MWVSGGRRETGWRVKRERIGKGKVEGDVDVKGGGKGVGMGKRGEHRKRRKMDW